MGAERVSRQGRTKTGRAPRRGSLGRQGIERRQNQRAKGVSASSLAGWLDAARSQVNLHRSTLVRVSLGGAAIACATALVLFASPGEALDAWFSIEAVDVVGTKRARDFEIRARIAVTPGANLLSVDPSAIEDAVRRHPWVSSVRVSRRLFHRLRVEITEHEPVALVALDHLYFVDATGTIVKRYAPDDPDTFPVITGFKREDLESEEPHATLRLKDVVRFFIGNRDALSSFGRTIEEVHVESGRTVSIAFADEPTRLHVSIDDASLALQRLRSANGMLRERGLVAIDLFGSGAKRPERVVARLGPVASARGD